MMATSQAVVRDARNFLRIENVAKVYGRRHQPNPVLRGISFSVQHGEVIAIIGPSGSGKSTLVRAIDQLEQIDGGAMYLDGELLGYEERGGSLRELSTTRVAAQRAKIGFVFQSFNLFPHLTALRNITLALVDVHKVARTAADARAREVLAAVGLADKADSYPAQLSGGQQQRVAIARALAPSPKLLLFDEPTSALDPELVEEVLVVMRNLAGLGFTMIVVTHELNFAREVADRVLFIDEGVVAEQGRPAEVLTTPRSARLKTFIQRAKS